MKKKRVDYDDCNGNDFDSSWGWEWDGNCRCMDRLLCFAGWLLALGAEDWVFIFILRGQTSPNAGKLI